MFNTWMRCQVASSTTKRTWPTKPPWIVQIERRCCGGQLIQRRGGRYCGCARCRRLYFVVGRSFHLSDGEEDKAGVAGEDIHSDSDKEADIVATAKRPKCTWQMALRQAALLSPRPALARWQRPLLRCPRPKTCVVHGNKTTGLLNAVPVEARRQFGRHNLNQMKHLMRHRMRYHMRCRAENIRCEHTTSYVMAYDVVCDMMQRKYDESI
jgi:hypothetical protein